MTRRYARRSIRLRGYDYAIAGAYFVTLLTWKRCHLFGELAGGRVHLSEYGYIAREEWLRTASLREYVTLDAYVIMPDHMHALIWLWSDAQEGEGASRSGHKGEAPPRPTPTEQHASTQQEATRPRGAPSGSLGAIIGAYKSAVTRHINTLRGTRGGRVWQRNYYEHIVRDPAALARIRRYIEENPRR